MKKIPLTQGRVTLVDDIDFDQLIKYKWHFMSVGYAGTDTSGKKILMHRLILGAKTPKERIDHINGDPLDNRRNNLRFATHQENLFNRGKNRNNTSGLKCVSWDRRSNKWRAYIKLNGEQIHLGLYDEKEEAHVAYCIAAEQYHGEFAHS